MEVREREEASAEKADWGGCGGGGEPLPDEGGCESAVFEACEVAPERLGTLTPRMRPSVGEGGLAEAPAPDPAPGETAADPSTGLA